MMSFNQVLRVQMLFALTLVVACAPQRKNKPTIDEQKKEDVAGDQASPTAEQLKAEAERKRLAEQAAGKGAETEEEEETEGVEKATNSVDPKKRLSEMNDQIKRNGRAAPGINKDQVLANALANKKNKLGQTAVLSEEEKTQVLAEAQKRQDDLEAHRKAEEARLAAEKTLRERQALVEEAQSLNIERASDLPSDQLKAEIAKAKAVLAGAQKEGEEKEQTKEQEEKEKTPQDEIKKLLAHVESLTSDITNLYFILQDLWTGRMITLNGKVAIDVKELRAAIGFARFLFNNNHPYFISNVGHSMFDRGVLRRNPKHLVTTSELEASAVSSAAVVAIANEKLLQGSGKAGDIHDIATCVETHAFVKELKKTSMGNLMTVYNPSAPCIKACDLVMNAQDSVNGKDASLMLAKSFCNDIKSNLPR